MNKPMIVLLSSCLVTSVMAATVISPNQNGNTGQIPSGFNDLEFQLANGNWVENIYLPKNARNGDRIHIKSSAQYTAYLDTSNTNLPIESFNIDRGSSHSFTYSSTQNKWMVALKEHSPINGTYNFHVPIESYITRISLFDGRHSNQISFPNNATHGAIINVISSATYNSRINPQNLLFPSSYTLKSGDNYWFSFNSELKKWVPISIKPHVLYAKDVGATMQAIQAPVTEVNFFNGNWIPSIELPATANDRDRVIFKSDAEYIAHISNNRTDTQATLTLKQGDRYEFMYVADQEKWILMSSPELLLQTKNFSQAQIPDMQQPTTRVKIDNSNSQSLFILPQRAKVGDKVIFSSFKDLNVTITANNGLNGHIKNGETQRYVYTSSGWVKDSATIDMLLVSSKEISNILGQSAAKLRLYEGVDLTNTSAENSHAQFYIRTVGYISYTIPTTDHTLNEALRDGRTDATIQNERNRLFADAVYYEGTEQGCGLAYVNVTPSSFNMIASGSINCGITVLRHEFGHNMGLSHSGSNTISQGFSHPLGGTAMGGNSIDFYSNPNVYHPKYGYRLGIQNKIDSVSLLNKNAPLVAAFK